MLILICASTLCVNAQTEVSVDGLRYSLYGIQATVIGVASGNTSEKIIVPESICYDGLQYKVYRIGSKCFYKNNGNTGYVKEVILPNTIESISNYAFSNSNIQKVKLEEGVTQILSHAFEESGIKEIVLPKSLVKYGDNVFFGCNLLSYYVCRRKYQAADRRLSLGKEIFRTVRCREPLRYASRTSTSHGA